MSEPAERGEGASGETGKEPAEGAPEPKGPEDGADRLVRRAFFVEGLRNMLRPVADLLENRMERVQEAMETSRRAAMDASYGASYYGGGSYYADTDASRLLRPPGALAEALFVERCAHSAQCVSACPVQAIQILGNDDPSLDGTPYIDPRIQACVVCEDLACMQACPSGALQRVPRHLIQMGVAELRRDTCLRSDGEDCQICVEKCPIGSEALEIPYHGADVEVKTDGCVGCGVCEMYCPTEPRAIVIRSPD